MGGICCCCCWLVIWLLWVVVVPRGGDVVIRLSLICWISGTWLVVVCEQLVA